MSDDDEVPRTVNEALAGTPLGRALDRASARKAAVSGDSSVTTDPESKTAEVFLLERQDTLRKLVSGTDLDPEAVDKLIVGMTGWALHSMLAVGLPAEAVLATIISDTLLTGVYFTEERDRG